MAVRFDNVADSLSRTTLPAFTSPFTWMAWVYLVSDPGAVQQLLAGTAGAGNVIFGLDGQTGGPQRLRLRDTDFGGIDGGVLDVGAWHHVAIVRTATPGWISYLDGVQDQTLSAGVGASTEMRVGLNGTAERFDGRVEAMKLWTTPLSAAQILAERFRYDPVVTSNNWAWWPLTAHTDVTDHSANARNWTVNGTLTTEAGPGGITEGAQAAGFADIVLYAGEANPNDVRLSDPTVLRPAGAVAFAVTVPSAQGLETFSGDAAVAFAVTVPAAAAVETFSGSGAAAFAATVPAVQASETFSGTGASAFAVTVPQAQGVEQFTGTGSAAFAVTVPAASGAEAFSGSGAASFSVTVPAASVAETISGSASVTLAATIPAASGLETFSGSGAVAFGVTIPSASAAETIAGTASVTLAATIPAATGAEIFIASGAATFGVTTPSAVGSQTFTGTGAAIFAVTGADGAGVVGAEPISGTASAAFAVTQPDAQAIETFAGDAATVFTVTQSTASGAETFSGDVTVSLAVTQPDAAGLVAAGGISGDASATFGVTIPAAAGSQTFAATGAAVFAVTIPEADGLVSEPGAIVGGGAAAFTVTEPSGTGSVVETVAPGGGGGIVSVRPRRHARPPVVTRPERRPAERRPVPLAIVGRGAVTLRVTLPLGRGVVTFPQDDAMMGLAIEDFDLELV